MCPLDFLLHLFLVGFPDSVDLRHSRHDSRVSGRRPLSEHFLFRQTGKNEKIRPEQRHCISRFWSTPTRATPVGDVRFSRSLSFLVCCNMSIISRSNRRPLPPTFDMARHLFLCFTLPFFLSSTFLLHLCFHEGGLEPMFS